MSLLFNVLANHTRFGLRVVRAPFHYHHGDETTMTSPVSPPTNSTFIFTSPTTSKPRDNSAMQISYLPLYCDQNASNSCQGIAMRDCLSCNTGLAACYLFCVVLLGFFIVVGNCAVLLVTVKRRIAGKLEKLDLHRISLAAADITSGIQLLIVPVYNFAWTFESTEDEVKNAVRSSDNVTIATACGILLLLCFTSSLYNLTYLAGQRLYAFVRPIDYKLQSKKSISAGLLVTWILAALTAAVPAMLPNRFQFTYYPNIFMYSFSQTDDDYSSVVFLFVFLILPYLITAVLVSVAAFVIHRHVRRTSQPASTYSTEACDVARGEITFFVTTLLMLTGFTVTSVPMFVVILVYYVNSVSYNDVAVTYAVCFYVSMTNSLVNVLVYNIRDSHFRTDLKKLFSSNFLPTHTSKTSSTPSSVQKSTSRLSTGSTGKNNVVLKQLKTTK